MPEDPAQAGVIPERTLNLITGGGLLALLLYGFWSWRATGEGFPADMRHSTLEILRTAELRAGDLGGGPADGPGRAAVELLAARLHARVRWVDLPPADLLRQLEACSLDVVAGYDPSLPGSDAYGLTRPYAGVDGSERVLAVAAGENRLLKLADEAARSLRGSTGLRAPAERDRDARRTRARDPTPGQSR